MRRSTQLLLSPSRRRPARRQPARHAGVTLESLENRTMFSTVDVASFGARPGDGRDDAAAVQAAIKSARAGDTVMFHSGQYDLNTKIQLTAGVTYTDDGNATLRGDGDTSVLEGNVDNITITNLGFQQGGVMFGKGNNVTVRNCTFTDIDGNNADGVGVFFNGLTNSSIDHNSFQNIRGWAGVHGYSPVSTHVDYNKFQDCLENIHLIGYNANLTGDTVSYNVGTGTKRAFMEIQDGGSSSRRYFNGLQVIGNYSSNFSQDWTAPGVDLFGCVYSIPLQYSTNTVIRGNYCDSTAGWALELCGENVTVENNTFGSKVASPHFSGNLIGVDGHQNNIVVQNNTLQKFNQVGVLSAVWGVNSSGRVVNNTLVSSVPSQQAPSAGAN